MMPVRSLSRRSLLQALAGAVSVSLTRLRANDHPTTAGIGDRLLEMDERRKASLRAYEVRQLYRLETGHAGRSAEMEVRMAYQFPGRKYFQILWQAGSSLVQRHVFQKLLDAEQDAAQDGMRDRVRISPQNYTFRLLGTAPLDGRRCYVVGVTPRTCRKYLVTGRVWVDAQDFAVARFEGAPAQNPSFWLRKIRMVQQYRKIGDFWMPSSNETDTEVRLFGPAHLNIQYTDYQIEAAGSQLQRVAG